MIVRRFIGGPLHGEIRALDGRGRYYTVPVSLSAQYSLAEERYTPWAPMYKVIDYEPRPLGFGKWASVEVMVPRDMGESEFMRRVADLIEGVGEKK